jgi:phosphocarrier protein HPr
MSSKTVTVGSSVGLHARPAAIIAEKAGELRVPVTLSLNGGMAVDAASSLMIMTLGAKRGDQVEVSSEDEAALTTIARLVEQDLDA